MKGSAFFSRALAVVLCASMCFASVAVPAFADFFDFSPSDIVDTQFSNWEQLPDDYKALGNAYIKFLKSDSLNSIFKNASDIPISWFKVMKDGTPVLSPVGNIFYLLDSAGELLFKDNTSGNSSAPRRAMNGDIVIGSNTFKDYVNNTANAYFPKDFAGKVSYRNDLVWHNKNDSNTSSVYNTMEFYTTGSGFSAVGGGDEIYLVLFAKFGTDTFYHKWQWHFWVTKEDVWYTDRDEIQYTNYTFHAEYWDNIDGSSDNPVSWTSKDVNITSKCDYYRLCPYRYSNRFNTPGVYSYNSYVDYLNYSNVGMPTYTTFDYTAFDSDLLTSIDLSGSARTHCSGALSTHDESCTYNGDCDFGYVASLTPIITTYKIDTSKIPDNYYVNVSGDTIYNYNITNPETGQKSTINEYITNNYTYITNPDDNNSGSGNGGVGGNVIVGGQIDVGGKVDVDVNVNINGGGNGNPNDYINPGDINTSLDDYISYIPEVSKGFIDYLKDFFGWLPPPVFGILMLGLIVSVFCRLNGR